SWGIANSTPADYESKTCHSHLRRVCNEDRLPRPDQSPEFWNSIPNSFLELSQNTFFSTDLREYFHASYWNSINAETGLPPGAQVLWKIRETLGRMFADKLASKVFRVAIASLS